MGQTRIFVYFLQLHVFHVLIGHPYHVRLNNHVVA